MISYRKQSRVSIRVTETYDQGIKGRGRPCNNVTTSLQNVTAVLNAVCAHAGCPKNCEDADEACPFRMAWLMTP